MTVGLPEVLGVGVAITVLGIFAMLVRKNLILMLMGLEMVLLGALLALVGAARYYSSATQPGEAVVLILLALVVAACEVAIGLALVLKIFKAHQSVWVDDLTNDE